MDQLELSQQQLELYRREVDALRRQARASVWAAIAGWVTAAAALLAVLGAFGPVRKTADNVEKTSRDVKSIETAVLSNRFTITSLSNGDEVSVNEVVSGLTPFPRRRHYLVVTPVKVGDSYVQGLITPRPDGTWSGTAKFGSGDVGRGEKFSVRCLAVDGELQTGSLASQALPADVASTPPVIVIWTQ